MDIVKGNGDKTQRDKELKGQRNWVTEESGKRKREMGKGIMGNGKGSKCQWTRYMDQGVRAWEEGRDNGD